MSCLDIEYFELVSTSCVLFNDYLNAYTPVNVIPQYPLYGDTGGLTNIIIIIGTTSLEQIPINIVCMRSVKSPRLCQISHPPGKV